MTLATFKGLYAPTFFFLKDQDKQNQDHQDQNQLPYTRRATPFQPSKKGKSRAVQDAEFERERAWLVEKLAMDDQEIAEKVNEEEYEDCEDGIECGCCFSTYPFVSSPFIIFSCFGSILSRCRIK
jgi:TRIAD3 protein (E3 ubiquitin-protein ligase RNF216)